MAARKRDSQDWVPADEAAHWLAHKLKGITRARQALAVGLREGLLSAAAQSSAISDSFDAEFSDEEAPAGELLGIPSDVWARSENFESDRLKWDWEEGDFDVHNTDWGETCLFYGVHFLRSELDAIDPAQPPYSTVLASAAPTNADVPAHGARRGPKTKTRKWGALIGAILELDRESKLNVGDFDDVGQLLKAVQSKIEPELLLDDRTVDGVLGYVWEHLLGGRAQRK